MRVHPQSCRFGQEATLLRAAESEALIRPVVNMCTGPWASFHFAQRTLHSSGSGSSLVPSNTSRCSFHLLVKLSYCSTPISGHAFIGGRRRSHPRAASLGREKNPKQPLSAYEERGHLHRSGVYRGGIAGTEGFTDIRYIDMPDPTAAIEAAARGEIDFGWNYE